MVHQHHAGHQHVHEAMEKRQDAQTVVQYVYKTAAKNFDGPVGGYKTIGAPPEASPLASSNNDNSDSNASSNSNSNDSSNSNSDSDNQQHDQQQQKEQQQQEQKEQQDQKQAAAASSQAAQVAAASSDAVSAAIAAAMATQQDKAAAATSSIAAETTSTSAIIKEKTSTSGTATKSHSATAASTTDQSALSTTPSSAGATSSASSSAAPSSGGGSGGLSSGGKAGLAIGILLAVGLLCAALFVLYRRRKAKEHEGYDKADDEKTAFAAGLNRSNTTTSTRTTATAPRLSLRPVTQFLPDLAAKGKAANAAAMAGGAGGAAMASRNQNDPNNPFGNHAAAKPPQRMSEDEKSMLPIQGTPENPFDDKAAAPGFAGPGAPQGMTSADAPAPLRVRTPTSEAAAAAGAGAAALGAAGVAAARYHGDRRENAPKPLNLSAKGPITPAGSSPAASEFSQTPASPGAMANGAPPSNVHRIQLDFKPSMDDELSLRAGQLVRLLHEYDDGWVSLSIFTHSQMHANILSRLSVSASTALNKVSALAHVFQLVLSSLARHQVPAALVLVAHLHQE